MTEYELVARVDAARQQIVAFKLNPPHLSKEREAVHELIQAQKALDDWYAKWKPEKLELRHIKKSNPLEGYFL